MGKKVESDTIKAVAYQYITLGIPANDVAERNNISTTYVYRVRDIHNAIMGKDWDSLVELFGKTNSTYLAATMATSADYANRIPSDVIESGMHNRAKLMERVAAQKAAKKKCDDVNAVYGIFEPPQDEPTELPDQLSKLIDSLNNALLCIHKDLEELTAEVKEMHDHMNVNADLTQTTIRDQTESIKTSIKKGRCAQ